MAGSWIRKTIHVVGYVTTVIVLVEMAGLGYASWTLWISSATSRARLREWTRTHDRALSAANRSEAAAAESYRPVRPDTVGTDDALGFVFMPSFSTWLSAGIRLPPGASTAQGEVVLVRREERRDDATFRPIYSRVLPFAVPRASYLLAAQQIDRLTGGWKGSARDPCYDGVPVAFERTRAWRITSGIGNAACDPHYAAVEQVMGSLLLRFGPKPAKSAPTADPPRATDPLK